LLLCDFRTRRSVAAACGGPCPIALRAPDQAAPIAPATRTTACGQVKTFADENDRALPTLCGALVTARFMPKSGRDPCGGLANHVSNFAVFATILQGARMCQSTLSFTTWCGPSTSPSPTRG
jgi:hypothetical protein